MCMEPDALNAWQIEAVSIAFNKSNKHDMSFVENDEVVDWLNSWGSMNEKDKPSCK